MMLNQEEEQKNIFDDVFNGWFEEAYKLRIAI